MAKSYKVGDTTYQFPDDFDDAKVQGILTEQGVIQPAEAPRDKNELPGYKEAEAWHEAESKKPSKSASQMLWDSVKQLGSAAVSPITALKDIPGALSDWAQGGFGAPALAGNGRLGPPDYVTQPNPATEATAMLSGSALLPAAIEGARGIPGAARTSGKAVADVVTSPPVIKGLKRSTEGVIVGSAMTGNIPGVAVGTAGRAAVGGLEAWIARRAAKASPAVTESPAPSASGLTLDAVAQGFGYKSFKGIKNPADQAAVTAAYERFVKAESGGGDIAPTPEATPPPTPGRFNSEEFRTPPQAAAPPVVEPLAPASPATPAPSKRVGGVKQVGLDARKLTDKLVEWKLSPDEAAGMPKAGWVKLAFEAGVPAPTAAVQRSTIFSLKKTLAGPPKTATELFEQFRKSGRETVVSQ